MYEFGEKIMVRDLESDKWCERIYISSGRGAIWCVSASYEDDFNCNKEFMLFPWFYHRSISDAEK